MLELPQIPNPRIADYEDLRQFFEQIIELTGLNRFSPSSRPHKADGILEYSDESPTYQDDDPACVFDITVIPRSEEGICDRMHFVFLWRQKEQEASVQARTGTYKPEGQIASYPSWEHGIEVILELIARSLDFLSNTAAVCATNVRDLLRSSSESGNSNSDRPTVVDLP